jgi:hypothetical protein
MRGARLLVLIAIAAALAGCSNAARKQARNFQCPGGTVIDVRFDDGGGSATVFAPDFTADVIRVPEGPGVRYKNEDTELVVGAATITVTRDGTVIGKDCKLADERPWVQKFY